MSSLSALYFSIILFLLFCFKDEALVDWVNPMYLDTGVVKDIRARFKDESEIQLQEFLLVNLHLISTFVTFSLLTDWECQRVKYLVQFCELLSPFFLRAGGPIGQMRPRFSPCICNSL